MSMIMLMTSRRPRYPRVAFSWEEPAEAEVTRIVCSCGYIDSERRVVHEGDIWECPRCHAKLRFLYAGWIYEVLSRGDGHDHAS